MSETRCIPVTMDEWFDEIARAYRDAREAIPFARVLGHPIREAQLWLAAPDVALKFRGLAPTETLRAKAANAAAASFTANASTQPSALDDRYVAFAFGYIASHFGLELLSAHEADAVMEHIELNRGRLVADIEGQHGA